jgi:hypothetical protein
MTIIMDKIINYIIQKIKKKIKDTMLLIYCSGITRHHKASQGITRHHKASQL